MRPDDREVSHDKPVRFLCGWLGGPKRYHEKCGGISIRRTHEHVATDSGERVQWLTCMAEVLAGRPFEPAFNRYLLGQLFVPAEAIRRRVSRLAGP